MEMSKSENNGSGSKRMTIRNLLKNSNIDIEVTESQNSKNNSGERIRESSADNSSITSQNQPGSTGDSKPQKCDNLASYSPGSAQDHIVAHSMQRVVTNHANVSRRMPETHQTMYRHFTMLYECNICKSIFRSFELFSHHKINACFDKRHQIAIHNNFHAQHQQSSQPHSQAMQAHNYRHNTATPYFPAQQQHTVVQYGNHSRINSASGSRRGPMHITGHNNNMLGRSHSASSFNRDQANYDMNYLTAAKSAKFDIPLRTYHHAQQNEKRRPDESQTPYGNGDSLTNKRKCEFCDHYFGKVSSLRKHIETCHKQDLTSLNKSKLALPSQEFDRSSEETPEFKDGAKGESESSATPQIEEDESSEESDELKLEVDEESPKIEMTSIFN